MLRDVILSIVQNKRFLHILLSLLSAHFAQTTAYWLGELQQHLKKKITSLNAVVCLTNRFHVAMRLFSNRSQMTSKCGKNKKVAHEAQPSVSLMFLPHFDILCDLLLNRCTATWNLFVLNHKELKYKEKKPFYFKIFHFDRHENGTLT